MDKIIAELLASVAALTEATAANTAILERVVAGQERAMEKLEGQSGTTTRKPRQTKAEKEAEAAAAAGDPQTPTPTPAAEAPVTESAAAAAHVLLASPNSDMTPLKNPRTGVLEDTPTAKYRAADFSREQVKNEFIGWLGETDNADERKERAAFVAAIGQHFGVKQPFSPTDGLADDEQRKQTLFFLRRKREGLKVDFSTDYNFDADPLADQTVEQDGGDDFDALG